MYLIELLDKYNSKDDLEYLLNELDFPEYSTKKEMLIKIGEKYNRSNAGEILVHMDTLKLRRILIDEEIMSESILKLLSTSVNKMVNNIVENVLEDDKGNTSIESRSIKLFDDEIKNKLSELLFYLTREDVQNLLIKKNLPVSGNKQQLIVRIIEETNAKPENVLPLIDAASLQIIAVKAGLERKKTKNEQISEILEKKFEIPYIIPLKVEKESTETRESPLIFENEKSNKMVTSLDYLSREEIKFILQKIGLPVSGNKIELINRVVIDCNENPRKMLNSMYLSSLQTLADRYGLLRHRSKEDQIEEIMKYVFREEKNNKEIKSDFSFQPETKQFNTKISIIDAGFKQKFDEVIEYIDQYSAPFAWPEEGGYRADLVNYLRQIYSKTKIEQGVSRIDILVDGEIPLEVKLNPDKKELVRAFEQADRHLNQYGCLIEVVFKPLVMDRIIEFEEQVQKNAKARNFIYRLIIKR